MEKNNRGGKREGAGRPKRCGATIAFRPDLDLEEAILKRPNKGRFINDCIRYFLKMKEPG